MKRIKVYVMDLLCMSPYHDRYFCEALEQESVDSTLGSISFHLDKNYFRRNGVRNDPGLLDVVARLPIRNRALRQGLKFLECCVNLVALCIRFLLSKPDVIHVEWLPLVTKVPLELWFLRFAKKLGVKLVYSVHNVLPHDTGDRYRATFQRVYSMTDALICHTDESRGRLLDEFEQAPHRIEVIPLGPTFYDVEQPTPQRAKAELGVPADELVVLLFGAIAPYKGLDFLLDCWSVVQSNKVGGRLILAGLPEIGMDTAIRQKVQELQLQDSVRLDMRFVPTELLPVYYQAADVLVYPYKAITMSGGLLTGLSFGKAVLATDLSGFRELIHHGQSGWLVPYGGVPEFSSALARLLRDPTERARLAEGARERFHTIYSWSAIATQTRRLYESVLAAPLAQGVAVGS